MKAHQSIAYDSVNESESDSLTTESAATDYALFHARTRGRHRRTLRQ